MAVSLLLQLGNFGERVFPRKPAVPALFADILGPLGTYWQLERIANVHGHHPLNFTSFKFLGPKPGEWLPGK